MSAPNLFRAPDVV